MEWDSCLCQEAHLLHPVSAEVQYAEILTQLCHQALTIELPVSTTTINSLSHPEELLEKWLSLQEVVPGTV